MNNEELEHAILSLKKDALLLKLEVLKTNAKLASLVIMLLAITICELTTTTEIKVFGLILLLSSFTPMIYVNILARKIKSDITNTKEEIK